MARTRSGRQCEDRRRHSDDEETGIVWFEAEFRFEVDVIRLGIVGFDLLQELHRGS